MIVLFVAFALGLGWGSNLAFAIYGDREGRAFHLIVASAIFAVNVAFLCSRPL